MKSYTTFILVIACLVIVMLEWIAQTRLKDFKSYHVAIAQESTAGISNEISRFVGEKKRLVKLFANEHLDLIRKLAEAPNDGSLHLQLEQRIAEYFPYYFTFTVADPDGQPYMEDFDGLIGERCRDDISKFVDSGTQNPRVHPHAEAYHFDILAPYGSDGSAGILFVSFHADILGGALKSAETPGHQLMLVYPEASQLIEVTSDGARINWDRNDYRLSPDEQSRILFRKAVPGTVWEAVDLHTSTLFAAFRGDVLRQSAIIFLLFATASIAMLFYVRREERLRRAAESHKDEFLSVVSHELRTPLTSIRGALALIANNVTGDVCPKTAPLADIALTNSIRLETLVNDILDVQKMEAGKMDFDMQPAELVPLVERSIRDCVAYGEQFGSTFTLKSAPPGIIVNVDRNRFSQIMANLLSNAAKYGAEADAVEVAVVATGANVRINVTDHGPGIPESDRARIFQKFIQADSSDSRKVSGTGLGLSIVKLIAEEHGGTAGCESQLGAGSTFYIDLPVYMQS
jgi:signal transduction histidine kinase